MCDLTLRLVEEKMKEVKMERFCTFPPFGTQAKTKRKQKSGIGLMVSVFSPCMRRKLH